MRDVWRGRHLLRRRERYLAIRRSGVREHPLQLGAGIGGTHECLAYQEGIDTPVAHPLHVLRGEDAALGDDHLAWGNPVEQRQGGVERGVEGPQVANC